MYEDMSKMVPGKMVPENSETQNRRVSVEHPHIAKNIAETCQKYFQSFIAIEILQQHFFNYSKIFHCNITILTF